MGYWKTRDKAVLDAWYERAAMLADRERMLDVFERAWGVYVKEFGAPEARVVADPARLSGEWERCGWPIDHRPAPSNEPYRTLLCMPAPGVVELSARHGFDGGTFVHAGVAWAWTGRAGRRVWTGVDPDLFSVMFASWATGREGRTL